MTKTSFCRRNFFLSHKIISVTETFCHRHYCDKKKLFYVTGTDFCDNDLKCCNEVVKNNGIILCDDYDLSFAPGVKKAVDEFVQENNFDCQIICNKRFAKIQIK